MWNNVDYSILLSKKSKSDWQEIQVINSTESACGCSLKVKSEYLNLQLEVVSFSNYLILNSDTFTAIVINKDSSLCSLIVKHSNMVAMSKICNCPADIFNWDLTRNKTIKLKISGKILEPCTPSLSISNTTYSDFILTKMYKEK